MLDWQLPIYATIQSKIALLEAMKARNIERLDQDKALAYSEEHFYEVSLELDQLAEAARP